MAAGTNDDDDDWEYEYSTTETETYYVDLDLSSVNGVIKSKNAGDRKSLKRSKSSVDDKSGNKTQSRPDQDDPGDDPNDNADDDVDDEREAGDNQDAIDPPVPQSPREPGLLDEDYANRMQILDFNTTNPIVSFKGHLYSCTWHDMLGTSMFVTKHQEAPFHEPEISTEDYDLIGTTRIKLVGHRAKILPKAGSKKRRREDDEHEAEENSPSTPTTRTTATATASTAQHNILDGTSLGSITRTNPRTNIEIKQQANFLERLMEVKKSRGEHDVVRTFVDRRTVAADARQARKAKTLAKGKAKAQEKEKRETQEQRLRREINELNQRVVKGDNDALERLQEIYADLEEVEDDDEDDELVMVQDASAAAAAPPALTTSTSATRTSIGNAGDPGDAAEGSEESPHVADANPNGASGSAALD